MQSVQYLIGILLEVEQVCIHSTVIYAFRVATGRVRKIDIDSACKRPDSINTASIAPVKQRARPFI